MASQTYSFPVAAPDGSLLGNLNCTVLPPLLGRAKRFRKLKRSALDTANRFNALVEERSALVAEIAKGGDVTAEQTRHDEITEQLDSLDEAQFQAMIDQVSGVLGVVSFTPASGMLKPDTNPTLKDVDWDSVDAQQLNAINSFFAISINS